jgi:putative toxin-antitoxin system antitoxin component (TIGR02293 family)
MSSVKARLRKKSSSSTVVRPRRGGKVAVKTNPSSGAVSFYCLHHPTGKSGGYSPSKLIQIIKHGLPVQELDVLQASLDMPLERLASKLGISKATLHRRKSQGRLGREESDRVLRFARLMGKAVEVLEGEENARRWLSSSQFGLGGAVPLDYAETEVGAREVEDLLGRIEYGVYS